MFRSTVVRSAAASKSCALSTSRRTFASAAGRQVRQPQRMAISAFHGRRVAAMPTPAYALSMRWYSAGGGLNKEEVEGRITSLLKGFDKVNDPANITSTSHFSNDLGLDSLDSVELVMAIEEEFSIEIPDKDADNIHSVEQAVQYILSQPDAH